MWDPFASSRNDADAQPDLLRMLGLSCQAPAAMAIEPLCMHAACRYAVLRLASIDPLLSRQASVICAEEERAQSFTRGVWLFG